MSTVYGPVTSWRFGRSLGIDIVVPPKTCSFNCVYCQLGRTKVRLPSPDDFEGYVTADDVKRDLEKYLADIDMNSVDVVTFSGSGEPTLNPEIGDIAHRVLRLTDSKIPLVLLTNSSLLYRQNVRKKLTNFDVVVAKLDAGDEKAYRIINRPVKSAPDIKTVKESIKQLKKETQGKLMIQSMFLYTDFGFTNCKGDALNNLIDASISVEPDVIQIDTPYRPGGEEYVKPASVNDLRTIGNRFEESIERIDASSELWVFGIHDRRGRKVEWKEHVSIADRIVELLKRRPCRVVDIADSIDISYKEALTNIQDLLRNHRITAEVVSGGEKHYRAT